MRTRLFHRAGRHDPLPPHRRLPPRRAGPGGCNHRDMAYLWIRPELQRDVHGLPPVSADCVAREIHASTHALGMSLAQPGEGRKLGT